MSKSSMILKISMMVLTLVLVLALPSCDLLWDILGGETPDTPPETEYYKVVFRSENGDPDVSITVEQGNTIPKIADPVCEGYTFLGWYKEISLINKWDFSNDTVTCDTILYAGWKKNAPNPNPTPDPDPTPNPTEFTVVFKLNNGQPDVTVTVQEGNIVTKPEDPVRDGYTFAGWFADEDLVIPWDFATDKITSDTTIYASWAKNNEPVPDPDPDKTYTITYIDAPYHENPKTYTSADNIILQRAAWNGLSFSHWSDKDGNVVTEIPSGTTGNITLFANWKYIENLVVSNNTDEIYLMLFNEEMNAYHFVFDLGYIQNVVLDKLTAYSYQGATSHTWSISETVSFTQGSAEEVAKTITSSVTNSSSWSSAIESATNSSNSTNTTTGASISADFKVLAGEIHNSKGKSYESGSSNATSNSKFGSSESSTGSSKTVSSTITFVEDVSTQITHSETLDPTYSPAGMYKYVHAGTIAVFAIVTYDIETKNYYINIYSYIDEIYDTMLYEPTPEYNSGVNIVESDPFSFDFNIEEIEKNIIDNSYFIEFDANGGEGTMPTQMMLPNSSTDLHKNQFTKSGSIFIGWRIADGNKSIIYTDGQNVENLGSPGETIVLEAVWTKDPEVDVAHTATTKNGYVSKYIQGVRPEIKYEVIIEYRNRTANSVEIKMTWTSTIAANQFNGYKHNFVFKAGSTSSGTVNVVPFNAWINKSSSARSCTGETGWITVPLNTQNATTVDMIVYYWQADNKGNDLTQSDNFAGVYETWTINIPAYR